MSAKKWWSKRLKEQGLDDAVIQTIVAWVTRRSQSTSLYDEISKSKRSIKDSAILDIVQSYVRCIKPKAVVDLAHWRGMCPYCGYISDDDADSRNQVCSNCARPYTPVYMTACPCCNSGMSHPVSDVIRGDARLDPVSELYPVVWSCEEDHNNYPPYTPAVGNHRRWRADYSKFTCPEYVFHLVCPLCLFEWDTYIGLPEEFTMLRDLCPICGSPCKATRRKGKYGGKVLECTNPDCEEGDLGVRSNE